jgi:hypothetical protein
MLGKMLLLLLKNKKPGKLTELLEVIQNNFFRKPALPTQKKFFTQPFVENYFWNFFQKKFQKNFFTKKQCQCIS